MSNKKHDFKVGDKIKFAEEKQRYTIKACSDRFLICTKPFNALKTYLYTIVDFERSVRGADNSIFSDSYETEGDCEKRLMSLVSGDAEVSYRNCVPLHIEAAKKK